MNVFSLVTLSLLSLFACCFGYDEEQHEHIHPKEQFINGLIMYDSERLGDEWMGSLVAETKTTDNDEELTVVVSWGNLSYTGKYDWIGLFNHSNEQVPFDSPPIKFQYICPRYKDCTYAPSSGSLTFKLLNRRTNYIFVYVSGSSEYRNIKGISNVVTFKNLNIPMNPHIAVIPNTQTQTQTQTDDNVAMEIIWIQKSVDTSSTPMVKYGTSKNDLSNTLKTSQYHRYTSNDMCDKQFGQLAGLSGWFDPGYTITADLYNLKPNTQYFYAIYSDSTTDSGNNMVYNFTTQPLAGDGSTLADNTIKFIAFGDLGNVAIDYCNHHSWDWYNRGEIYSINTTNMIAKNFMSQTNNPIFSENNNNNMLNNGNSVIKNVKNTQDMSNFLLHIGDISYAVGYISEWDDFLHQIKPIASHIPYMTGIGNHEYSHSKEWNPAKIKGTNVTKDAYSVTDGNGECGVPYNTYFPFANNNPTDSRNGKYNYTIVQPWYSFEYGFVKVFMLSTEHDYSKLSSLQYEWFENELKNVDRTKFPWIIVTGHRPMYVNSDFDGDTTTAQYLRYNLESLFNQYNVAIALWGHQHAYARTCNLYNSKCNDDNKGTTHLVIGMAGYELTRELPKSPESYFKYVTNQVYGFTHFTMYNKTHSLVKFINSLNGDIVDQAYIVNPYQES